MRVGSLPFTIPSATEITCGKVVGMVSVCPELTFGTVNNIELVSIAVGRTSNEIAFAFTTPRIISPAEAGTSVQVNFNHELWSSPVRTSFLAIAPLIPRVILQTSTSGANDPILNTYEPYAVVIGPLPSDDLSRLTSIAVDFDGTQAHSSVTHVDAQSSAITRGCSAGIAI
jgi:hypothetical protein